MSGNESLFREVIEEWFIAELPKIIPREIEFTLSDNAQNHKLSISKAVILLILLHIYN
ncbi:MAG TPA: hypothetical protein VKU94_06905 [Geobacterales bacterium]|nr:hypothetical protein [Geobacterales bacterium]